MKNEKQNIEEIRRQYNILYQQVAITRQMLSDAHDDVAANFLKNLLADKNTGPVLYDILFLFKHVVLNTEIVSPTTLN